MPNNYELSKIYRIVCQNDFYYIGSTTQSLDARLKTHKNSSHSKLTDLHIHINTIGWDDVSIELVEEYPCKSKKELYAREQYYVAQSKHDKLCLN